MFETRHRSHPELLRRRLGRASKRTGAKSTIGYVTRKRSDRTEAQIRCLVLFFSRCAIDSLTVGRWQQGAIEVLDLGELAQGTGLSRWRLDRAISDLRAAGYIYRHQSRDVTFDANGSPAYTGNVATLKLTLGAFGAFGITRERLEVFRRRGAEHARKQEKRALRGKPVAPVGKLISSILDPAINDLRPSLPQVKDADRATFVAMEWTIGTANPAWTVERVYREAHRQLYGPKG